jgi:hypothetical protein
MVGEPDLGNRFLCGEGAPKPDSMFFFITFLQG